MDHETIRKEIDDLKMRIGEHASMVIVEACAYGATYDDIIEVCNLTIEMCRMVIDKTKKLKGEEA